MPYVDMISDILLVAGALAAAFYCFVLARRLKRFNNLQNGVGGAVAVLSAQVDDMTKTLDRAQAAAATSAASLTLLTKRAEDVSRRLELMMASMHDLPEAEAQTEPVQSAPAPPPPLILTPSAAVAPEPAVTDGLPQFLSKRGADTLEAAE